jgi:hypothetical protein
VQEYCGGELHFWRESMLVQVCIVD